MVYIINCQKYLYFLKTIQNIAKLENTFCTKSNKVDGYFWLNNCNIGIKKALYQSMDVLFSFFSWECILQSIHQAFY